MSAYLDDLFGLSGRLAVVTGGSSGIGRAMAVALCEAGARVVVVARRAEPGEGLAAVRADLGDRRAVHAAVRHIRAEHGQPDILVNAAGVNRRPHLSDLTENDWDVTLAVNLTAPFLLGQAFGPAMAARGWGRIVNVVSQQAFRAYGNSGAYGVSKSGLVGLTRSQAEAWSGRGVCCNAVAPGVVRTPLTEDVVFTDPDVVRRHEQRALIGRNGVPQDFAGMAIYLASRASAAVTGQTLFVDGGYSAS